MSMEQCRDHYFPQPWPHLRLPASRPGIPGLNRPHPLNTGCGGTGFVRINDGREFNNCTRLDDAGVKSTIESAMNG
jgi:hypothetical protein